ncbi:MAG: cell division protein FtsQ [Lutibacter sp.]|uniref:cell division protein FtsQ/DivIB n=1 Tax=Lutibacter sp. TaxID=1925666 RepID=UPI00299E929D|nr:cell division protein FtsQ [Lutibacter sp.]MDX1829334.1 cell division protein FtsQ [Lutibacter sp.]
MKINWIYIKGLALLALVTFLYGFSNYKNEQIKVKKIVVQFEKGTNLFMNYQMVNKLLIQNNESPKKLSKSVIDLHKLESKVLSHPMVEDAAVFLTVDGLLKATIKQRTPIARVITDNRSYYLDKQGETMPLSPNYSERVMLIFGDVNKKDDAKIHKLVTAILRDEILKKLCISIQKSDENEFVLNTRIGSQKILVGNLRDLNQKLKNLKSFLNKTIGDKTINNYALINLKYNNQVVCTKK